MIQLIISDIGGILLDPHGELPQTNVEALRAAVERGVRLALATIRKRDSVEVIVPALDDRRWAATVAEVVPAIDPATRTQLVKIDLPKDPALRSGLFARARFLLSKFKCLALVSICTVLLSRHVHKRH